MRPNWSPDGQWIVFERLLGGVRRLWRLRPDGTGEEPLDLGDPAGSNSTGRPAFFAPDDFVFVSDRSGQPALYRSRGGAVSLLHAADVPCHGPALPVVGGAGPLLYFRQPNPQEAQVWRLDASGGSSRLTGAGGLQDQPWPLPGGERFVSHAQHEGQQVVCVQALNADAPAQVLSDGDEGTAYVTPYPSPDGAWVAFASARSGRSQIWAMRLDGTGRRQLTHGEPHSFPAWSPDGRALVCVQGEPLGEQPSGRLVLVDWLPGTST